MICVFEELLKKDRSVSERMHVTHHGEESKCSLHVFVSDLMKKFCFSFIDKLGSPRIGMILCHCHVHTLSKVQKILRNATRSENMFQSFNIEIYEKFFLVEFLVLGA